jgi:hypothetical protein
LASWSKRKSDPPSKSFAAAGASVRRHYEWKQKFGSQEVNDAQRLRLLEEENRNLKELVADQAGRIHIPERGKR